jgi:16S rRNA U516 pseudouridylate synthase RsuA-like enzyme
MQPIRLNKFLAERLGLSRREADAAISAGRVTINGQVTKLGDRIALSEKQEANIDRNYKVCYNCIEYKCLNANIHL